MIGARHESDFALQLFGREIAAAGTGMGLFLSYGSFYMSNLTIPVMDRLNFLSFVVAVGSCGGCNFIFQLH